MSGVKHERWPADRFYWALLEAPGLRRSGPLPAGLCAVLEDEIPDAPLALCAVAVPADGAAFVCAVPRSALASLDRDVLSLVPESLPPFAPPSIQPEDLNLLIGDMQPACIRRARSVRHVAAIAATILCGVLVAIGLFRRADDWAAEGRRVREASASLLRSVAPDADSACLTQEVQRWRLLAKSRAESPELPDAGAAFSSLLAAWPARVASRPQSIAVNSSGMTVAVAVDGDSAPFLDAFRPPAGWTLDEPRINTAGSVTRLTLQLRRNTGASR